ncbi:MAG: sensor histidine kinase [Rikenellaceae bacterium]
MLQEKKILTIEYMVIALLWIIVIASPLMFLDDLNKNWKAVHIMWAESSVVCFAFVVNRFLLMPQLFFRRKYTQYALSMLLIFLLLAIFIFYFDGVSRILSLFGEESMRPMHIKEVRPYRPSMHLKPPHNTPSAIPPAISVLIFSAVVVALDMGLSIAVKWVISEQKQVQIDKERVSTQLSNLQSQVSPHFFMNTLNNIHALVDIDAKRAKQTIIELSSLMDYLLYESSDKERVSLYRELDFIESYINLMRLRYPKRVVIDFYYNKNIPPLKIPPLLFLNFIENAFKYGVDYSKESFIRISFRVHDNFVEMTTINSNNSASVKTQRHGLGISNSRKRLKLLYEDRFTLDIKDKEGIFYVTLKIPVK